MINVTDSASEELKRVLEKQGNQGKGLRISVKGGGCSGLSYNMDFDSKQEKDHEFEVGGVKVFCDPKSYLYVNGLTLDYLDALMNGGFKFINPNATGTCSCGESFKVS